MKVGDLIRDKEYPEDIGVVMKTREESNGDKAYKILDVYGEIMWFSGYYIENGCELVYKSLE